jgi:hypothetical protein
MPLGRYEPLLTHHSGGPRCIPGLVNDRRLLPRGISTLLGLSALTIAEYFRNGSRRASDGPNPSRR